jgi:hypothetical protein
MQPWTKDSDNGVNRQAHWTEIQATTRNLGRWKGKRVGGHRGTSIAPGYRQMTKTSVRKRKTERKPRQASSSEACKEILREGGRERERQSVNQKTHN